MKVKIHVCTYRRLMQHLYLDWIRGVYKLWLMLVHPSCIHLCILYPLFVVEFVTVRLMFVMATIGSVHCELHPCIHYKLVH